MVVGLIETTSHHQESPFIAAQQGPLTGLFAKILEELSLSLNFSMTIAYKEESYGNYNETTGQWTGVIGRLHRRDVDLGVAEFTMTEQRLDTVDFTLPIMLSRNHLYMRQPEGSVLQWSAYFRVRCIFFFVYLFQTNYYFLNIEIYIIVIFDLRL